MPQLEKDYDIVTHVASGLTHWLTINYNQGALTEYSNMGVGGPPGFDVNPDVRESDEVSIETEIPGDTASARAAFVAQYAQGATFDCKASASGIGDLAITGVNRVGRRFTVVKADQVKTKGENSKLTVTMKESGATPSGGGG